MKKTDNYGLALFEKTDNMSITAEENSSNANMKIIDKTLKEKATIQDMTNYIEEHKEELKGEKGDTGATGPQGEVGPQGPKGEQGVQGLAGKDGTNGTDGVSVTHSWDGTTLTVTSASGTTSANLKGEKGDKGDKGPQGEKGETGATGSQGPKGDTGSKGADGYTPVKGTDYWTTSDKEEIKEYVKGEIPTKTSQLTNDAGFLTEVELTQQQLDEITDAVVESQKVEIANSIDEMTDTTKRYVLPDGYIYEYKLVETTGGNYTNLIDTIGYTDGKYVSGNTLGTDTTTVATGAIPYNCKTGLPPTIYVKGVDWTTDNTHCRMVGFTDVECTTVSTIQITSSSIANININVVKLDDKYYKFEPALSDSGKWIFGETNQYVSAVRYVRMSFVGKGEDMILTSEEPIEDGTTLSYEWVNTGLTFTPTDYGDEITALENRTTTIEGKIDELVMDANGIPLYVTNEAERVVNTVQSKRTVGSLTFTAMSDAHVYIGTTTSWLKPNETSVRDAGLGLSELRKHLQLDFVAMLGDYTYASPTYTIDQLKKDLQYFKKCMSDGCKGIPNLWATGNHDINYGANADRRMTEDELYAHIISNNVGTIQDTDNIERNYGYIDFENQKFRCILLNSVDALDYPDNTGTSDDALEITATQTQWLVDVGLDLSKKTVPEDWQIIIFTHQALNLYSHVMTVLEAHKNGTSGSVDVTTNNVTTTVNYDFTNKTRGEVIANVHGHNHNFTAKKIGISEEWLWRICVPNMDVTRNNEAATSTDTTWAKKFGEFDEEGKPVYYNKTQGTATSTSFCVFTIDRKNRKIHALRYGAGIDRELDY